MLEETMQDEINARVKEYQLKVFDTLVDNMTLTKEQQSILRSLSN